MKNKIELSPGYEKGRSFMKMKSTFLALFLLVAAVGASTSFTVPRILNPFTERDSIYVSDYKFYANGEDWQPAIQKAIDDAYSKGIPQVIISKNLLVYSPVQIKEGITLKGGYSPGFFNGMRWYTDENKDLSVPKIKAGKVFSGGVVQYSYTDNDKGISIENIVIDGNKKADYGFYASSSSLKELNINLEELGIQGAKLDGIRLERVLTTKIINCNINANGSYGINFNIGASDSTLIGNYIHGNQNGGVRMTGGSHYNQIASGKIEDNYGSGVLLDGANGGSNRHIISNVVFHANNGSAITALNGASSIVNACQFGQNGVTQTNEASANLLSRGANSFLQIANSQFSLSSKTKYHASALETSRIFISDSVFNKFNSLDGEDSFVGNVSVDNFISE